MDFNTTLQESESNPRYEEYNISLRDDADLGFKQRFIYHCIEHDIPEEYAQLFVDFLQEEQQNILDNASKISEKILRERWGNRYRACVNRAKQAVIALDRQLEGRLIPFFEEGYGNHPVLIEMLAFIGSTMEEDSIAMPVKGFHADKAMSTEEFLTKVVFK